MKEKENQQQRCCNCSYVAIKDIKSYALVVTASVLNGFAEEMAESLSQLADPAHKDKIRALSKMQKAIMRISDLAKMMQGELVAMQEGGSR